MGRDDAGRPATGRDDTERSPNPLGGPATRRLASALLAVVLVLSLTAGTAGVAVAGGGSVDATAVADDQLVDRFDRAGDLQSGEDEQICERNASTFVEVYNAQIDSVPGLVRDRVSGSNVHLQVDDDADRDYTLVANQEGQVVKYREGKPQSASLRVETDCATFQEITDSSEPSQTFREAYSDGRIRLVGIGYANFVFFEAIDRVDDPISLVIFLIVFLLLVVLGLVVLYVIYRRLAIYYRGDDDETGAGDGDTGPDEGPGPASGDAAAAGATARGAPADGTPAESPGQRGGSPQQGGQTAGQPGEGGADDGPTSRSGTPASRGQEGGQSRRNDESRRNS